MAIGLITGAGGFLGRQIVLQLANKNNKLFCPYLNTPPPVGENIIAFRGDIADLSSWKDKIPSKIDFVVHFAAKIPPNNNGEYYLYNTLGTANILELCTQRGSPLFIYASTLYLVNPRNDEPILDTAPLYSTHPYYISKYFGEILCQKYSEQTGARSVCFRISSPYGDDMSREAVIMKFIAQCMRYRKITVFGHGYKVQNFIDCKDIACAVESALERGHGIYNLCNNVSTSIKELANIICEAMDNGSEVCFNSNIDEDVQQWIPSTTKIAQELCFYPQNTVQEGIAKLCSNYIKENKYKAN